MLNIKNSKLLSKVLLVFSLVITFVAIVPNSNNTYEAHSGKMYGAFVDNINIDDSWDTKHNGRSNAKRYSMDNGKNSVYLYINDKGFLNVTVGKFDGSNADGTPNGYSERTMTITNAGEHLFDFPGYFVNGEEGYLFVSLYVTDNRTKGFSYHKDPAEYENYIKEQERYDRIEREALEAEAKKKSANNQAKKDTNTKKQETKANSNKKETKSNDSGKTNHTINTSNAINVDKSNSTNIDGVSEKTLVTGDTVTLNDDGNYVNEIGEIVHPDIVEGIYENTDVKSSYRIKTVRDYYDVNVEELDIISRGSEVFPLLSEDNTTHELTMEPIVQKDTLREDKEVEENIFKSWLASFINSLTNTINAFFR